MNNPIGPSGPNFPNTSFGSESATGLRNSLAYELIGSSDRYINHPSGITRVVTYPLGDAQTEQFKDKLLDLGLILGYPIDAEEDSEHAFIVPRSARPLAYDAESRVKGNYSYDDDKLFYDLGYILNTVLKIDEVPRVIRGDIGHVIAITEFTKPNERPLFLVPGVERVLEPLEDGKDPFAYYSEALDREFGMRFRAWGIALRTGYERAQQDPES